MSKIPANNAAALFEDIIGWPYASPGTSDQRGIDCSGAWVRVYRKFGESVYHGSNTIFRKHCTATGAIHSTDDLQVGMAVFKRRFDSREPSQYRGDGIGNMYHIGCVTGVNPLRIVHATSPVAKADSNLGGWTHWGKMDRVLYGVSSTPVDPAPAPFPGFRAKVTTAQGSLNLRAQPSTMGALITSIPRNAALEILLPPTLWLPARYNGKEGYVLAKYITRIPD